MQEKVERLLDKHMLKLGLSECCSVRKTRVTNVFLSRCIKAFLVDHLVRRVVEEDGKVRGQQLRGKSEINSSMLRASNIFNIWITAFQTARS